jgi:hypothetical protein
MAVEVLTDEKTLFTILRETQFVGGKKGVVVLGISSTQPLALWYVVQ